MKIKLSDVSGISGTPPEDGEVLIWDETLSQYVPGPQSGGGGGGGGAPGIYPVQAESIRMVRRYWRVRAAAGMNAGEFVAIGELRWRDEAGVNLVGSGAALSSSDYNTTYAKGKAYDGITGGSNGWISPSGTRASAWLGYDFTTPVDVRSIAIARCDDFSGASQWPSQLNIEASADGFAWTVIRTIDLISTPTSGTYYAFDVPEVTSPYAEGLYVEIPGGGGGGGDMLPVWKLLDEWDFATDGAIATLSVPLDGLEEIRIRVSDATKSASGWFGGDFSYDGGVTWVDPQLNFSKVWPVDGNIGAVNTGTDRRWYLHGTATAASRSAYGEIFGLSKAGPKYLRSNRTQLEVCLNRNVPTHFRVAALLDDTGGNVNFTSGSIQIYGLSSQEAVIDAGIEEAPEDGTPYVRQDGEWVPAPTGGGGGGGPVTGTMTQPYVVQRATLRNDGTLALVSPPTPGNVLLFVAGGWGGSLNSTSYFPAGFIYQGVFSSDSNNSVQAGWRLVVSGDTGSYAMSAGDNQFCALFEIAGVGSIVQLGQTQDIRGGAASPAFNMTVPEQYISAADLVFGCVTHDTTEVFTVTPETGLTVDFVTASLSHGGFVAHWDSTFDSPLSGSVSGLTSPIAGFWGVIGKFTPD